MAITQAQREKFIRDVTPAAEAASRATGIDRDVIIAQAAHESAWGTKAKGNNYFGIKGRGQTFMTTEVINGKSVKMQQGFRTYATPMESFMDWAKLMTSKARYAPVINATTPEAQIAALGASGYATDPAYASKLRSITSRVKGMFGALGDLVGFDGAIGIQGRPGARTLKQGLRGPDVASLQANLKDVGLYDGKIDGDYGPRTVKAVKQLQTAMGEQLQSFGLKAPAVDGKWGAGSTMAAKALNYINPKTPFGSVKQSGPVAAAAARYRALNQPDLPSFSEALAAKNALKGPQAAAAIRAKAAAPQPTFSAPKRVLTAPTPFRQPARPVTPTPSSARLSANGLTPEARQNSFDAARAQQARMAAAKAAAAQAGLAARPSAPQQTAIGNPAGIDMASRRRFTPNQMLDAVEAAAVRRELAARAAVPVPRPNPTPAGPQAPSAGDMARAAGAARAAALAQARASAPVPRANPMRVSVPVPRPNPTPTATARAPGASIGGYNPNAASSTGRAHALASTNVSAPRVATVSPTPRATTDVPASMRAGYPQANAAQRQLQGVTVHSAPARVLTAPRAAPVAVSKPAPVPARTFTSPQVTAAASSMPAGPQAAAAARYAGVMAAQAAKPVTPIVTAPKPVVAPVAVPKPPVPQPLAVPAPVAVVPPKPVALPAPLAPTRLGAAAAGASAAARAAGGATYTTKKGVTVLQSDMIGGRYGEASYGRKQSDGSVRGTTQSGREYTSRVNERTGRREHTVNGRTYSTDSKGRASREKVLCTYFMQKGWLPKRIWLQDGKEYKLRPGDQAEVMRLGYHWWAVPTVKFLETQTPAAKVAERILWPLIRAWSYEAAYRVGYLPKGTISGKIARAILEPTALIIGKIITSKRRLLYGG